ncbi:TatD family hydrolase [uncultured Bacteroides sp.]|uniref:TatD family hydrolase n=1 Tax=uncultured Bacteroides sp. TaxID=162156 RepID=UPI002AA838A5|nr:TatD family hydrolase [uncultured Bacteroides sp.]
MELLDIHTHHLPLHPEQAIFNCTSEMLWRQPFAYCSVGIHPWELTADAIQDKWNWLVLAAADSRVLAIGEAGLDRMIDVPFSLQMDTFERQIEFADAVGKPLVIHCVRAANEIIELKKKFQPHNPWIIHGFRGKKEQALQYVRHGLYLSFGERYQEEALCAAPADRLFLETDESTIDIHLLYQRAATVLSIPLELLTGQLKQNIGNVFLKG